MLIALSNPLGSPVFSYNLQYTDGTSLSLQTPRYSPLQPTQRAPYRILLRNYTLALALQTYVDVLAIPLDFRKDRIDVIESVQEQLDTWVGFLPVLDRSAPHNSAIVIEVDTGNNMQ
jgi:hypothetical protein